MISNHSEGTFGRLRYSLGGDRPSQTVHLTLSPVALQRGLEGSYHKGSIPPAPPRKLAFTILKLLPILYMSHKHSISSYSKAPWGLSVLSRVTCILTGTIISPSLSLSQFLGLSVLSRVTCIFTGTIISPILSMRQCPDRYAFRAGRNLPDTEFRYLRTVIVTAAVYWGFNSQRRLR